MNLFRSKKEKDFNQWQDEMDRSYEERVKKEEENAAERQEYIDELEEELIGEDTCEKRIRLFFQMLIKRNMHKIRAG